MTKKYEDMSYKEVHKKLEDAMQDVYTSDEAAPSGSPEIDYSFMDSSKEKKDRKQIFKSRFNKVAAIIIMVLLSMNIIMMATGAGVSYSEKGLLHRIYEGARGIFTDEDESEYVELDETGDTCVIYDMNKIGEAKKFWSELYIPKYIPKGYELKCLEITKNISNEYYAEYTFVKEFKEINVTIFTSNNDLEYISKNSEFVTKNEDRIINIYYDEINEYHISDVYFEENTIQICGEISIEDMSKIANNMRP